MTAKDTTLAAMKRAARAILRDDLRKLRSTIKLQAETLASQGHRNAQWEDRIRVLNGRLADMQKRMEKAAQWAAQNRKGDFSIRACLEYVQQGATPQTYGAGCMRVNPFDRWGVSPAIRD